MREYISLVTFSHTIFAMPFALLGFTLGALSPAGSFQWIDLVLVVGCMVFARNAAMAFNRLVDAEIDAQNARTAVRDIPSGRVSHSRAAFFIIANAVLFMVCAALLNPLCLWLSPVALATILGYSYTKRFTWLCHVVLGVGLALAPIGAFLAVTGSFEDAPIILGGVVLLWVAGFDIIYALQDEAFDTAHQLRSAPTRFGGSRSLKISRALHFTSAVCLAIFSYRLVGIYPKALVSIVLSALVFTFALIYQQRLVSSTDLSRVDRAFFTTNGLSSVLYAAILIPGLLIGSGYLK